MGKVVTKYMRLVQSVRELLAGGELKPGDRFFSEHALCEKFDLSRQTVRQALSLLEQDGLIERRRGSGTYVAGSALAARKRTMSVGVISSYLDDYIFPSQTRGVERVLSEHGYTMQLGITYDKVANESKLLRAMIDKDVDGILIEPAKSALPHVNAPYYKELMRKGIPILQVNTYIQGLSLPCVAVDDLRGGRMAAMHLIEMGHRAIGGIFKLDDYQGHLRYAGFMEALERNGLLQNEEHIHWYSTDDRERLFGARDAMIMERLRGCTAVFCYNDQVALAVIEQLRKNGVRVPEDMSVVGYDDSNLATVCTPGLTSIVHPGEKLGELAARHLLARIEDPAFAAGYQFEPQLVRRGSVLQLQT